MRWAAKLHDYDELSMNYCNCMILYEQFVDHSDNLIMSPLRCLAVRYMLRGIHITGTKAGDRVTHEMDCTLQWYAVVCCCFAQTAQSCSQRTFAPQQVETIQNEIGKTGKKSWTQLSHPSPE